MEHEEKEEKDKKEETIEDKLKTSEDKVNFSSKIRENPWIVSTLVLGILCLILLLTSFGGLTGSTITGSVISEGDAGQETVSLLSTLFGTEVKLISSQIKDDLYYLTVKIQEKNQIFIVTRDFTFIRPAQNPTWTKISDLIKEENQKASQQKQQSSELQSIPKSDKPKVKLFVMTHCPYGTQAEKGFIPAIKALGDNIDAKIKFVHYFMHQPEETETLLQVCIREEQSDKFLPYLECFLEDGNSERCLDKVEIDKDKMNECVSSKKADEYYKGDSADSKAAGVQGSPTLVIDGQIVSSGRSPAAYLATICSAFNEEPVVCEQELSSATPNPMWGWGEGTATQAQC